MTSNTAASAVRQHAICYAVIPAEAAGAGMRLRHRLPGNEFADHPAPLLVRYSQTENFADPDPRLVALRLTADVIADIGSRPPWQDLSIPQSMVALCAAAGDGSRPVRYNRAATELLHRLGSSLDQRVTGPLVIHAAPDADGIIASLSDGQLQCLMSHLDVVNRSIYGRQPLLAAV